MPESVLKKRKTRDALRAKAEAERKTEKAAAVERRKGMFTRAEAYLKEYKATARAVIDAKRAARAAGDYFVEPEAKLALVVRIRGINGVSPKVRRLPAGRPALPPPRPLPLLARTSVAAGCRRHRVPLPPLPL